MVGPFLVVRVSSKVTESPDFEHGTVKFVHRDGYGFVEREGKPDAYFHVERFPADLRLKLKAGVPVMVAVGNGKRGPVVLAVKAP